MITKGGTYTGNWESRDSEVPAVEIKTSEPVTIVNSNIRSAGYLIKSWGYSVNVTVKHTNGYGLEPTVFYHYKKPRRFLTADVFKNVVVEHCYLENTAGIAIATTYEGNNTTSETIKIRYNKVKNIDGRIYNGKELVNFVSFNYRGEVPHVEIAWNEIINEPNNSLVEENINLSNSRGRTDSPIRIHNNYIQGAYPYPATNSHYAGGGIITDSWYEEGMGDPASVATAHVKIYENQTVNLGNHNYAIAGGNNIEIFNNRAINSAQFTDGTFFPFRTEPMYGYDYYKTGVTFNNSVHNNVIGVTGYGGGWNNEKLYFPDGNVNQHSNNFLSGTITQQHERDEFNRWKQKLSSNGITVGPASTAPIISSEPIPVTAPEPVEKEENTTDTASGTGKIISEVWANVASEDITQIPLTIAPTNTKELTLFESPNNIADNYGQRIRGYITTPATGQYIFWIAGDNNAELYLSTSEDPTKKVKIAYVNGWTAPRGWNEQVSQKSEQIQLEAGKRYYIEVLHVEGAGGDHVTVGWQLPDGKLERPIEGNRLSPFDPANTIIEEVNTEPSVYPNPFTNIIVLDLGDQKVDLRKVVIMTLDGTLKYTVPNLQPVDNKLEIDLSKARLLAGTYFLKYTDSTGNSKTIRIVKE
ncbi:T9SS type A sorting domain-containing protein [Pontibacter sp. KCTC 32443]|uniref:PA14 domain-containing protein n=1 Tax=Pontibacter TaxID=323449 RepID=UPI00164D9A16|nr:MULTISPECIES: PA14 domain-containing protein [Pontibacter]MBC5774702.1 T9SS type A sorting domain-containing protein [Pontibacter sp. KCTC 32443]